MRQFLIGLCCFFLLAGKAIAAPVFPELTGRVVDDAHILSSTTVHSLDAKLADYEVGTSNQIVVVTVLSLGGETIEQYGVELGRHWQIGQKGTNNGVLLIVAPKEHQVRIEVGYGLEGTLTDAQSSMIINQIMVPEFRQNHPDEAVIDGTKAIMLLLGGKGVSVSAQYGMQPEQSQQHQQEKFSKLEIKAIEIFIFLICILLYAWLCNSYPNLAFFILRVGINIATDGISSSSSNDNRFSGGGGSFGGGGASGRW